MGDLFPASENARNCFPRAAACHAAAADPAAGGRCCLRAANVEDPGPLRIGRMDNVRRGCPNYSHQQGGFVGWIYRGDGTVIRTYHVRWEWIGWLYLLCGHFQFLN